MECSENHLLINHENKSELLLLLHNLTNLCLEYKENLLIEEGRSSTELLKDQDNEVSENTVAVRDTECQEVSGKQNSNSQLFEPYRDYVEQWQLDIMQRIGKAINEGLSIEEVPQNREFENKSLKDADEATCKMICQYLLLCFLSLESYSSYTRKLFFVVCKELGLEYSTAEAIEIQTSKSLVDSVEINANKELKERESQSKMGKSFKIAAASALGGIAIGVTGGLAAPLLATGIGSFMGALGLGATTASVYLGSIAGSSALVGALFGSYGASMAGFRASKFCKSISDFKFIPIQNYPRLHIKITISGWVESEVDFESPWNIFTLNSDVYSLRWEYESLKDLGFSFEAFIMSTGYSMLKAKVIQYTALGALMPALWPIGLIKVFSVVDNPWRVAFTRAKEAGKILADALLNNVHGKRPVTLIGYSLGAKVIYSCLEELFSRDGFGIVENVVFMGAPIPNSGLVFKKIRALVSSRIVNVFCQNDLLLASLYRISNAQMGAAGLSEIDCIGIENFDVSDIVTGHLDYRLKTKDVLLRIGMNDIDDEKKVLEPISMNKTIATKCESIDKIVDSVHELEGNENEK